MDAGERLKMSYTNEANGRLTPAVRLIRGVHPPPTNRCRGPVALEPLVRLAFSQEPTLRLARLDASERRRKMPQCQSQISLQVFRASDEPPQRWGLPTWSYPPMSSSGVQIMGIL